MLNKSLQVVFKGNKTVVQCLTSVDWRLGQFQMEGAAT